MGKQVDQSEGGLFSKHTPWKVICLTNPKSDGRKKKFKVGGFPYLIGMRGINIRTVMIDLTRVSLHSIYLSSAL